MSSESLCLMSDVRCSTSPWPRCSPPRPSPHCGARAGWRLAPGLCPTPAISPGSRCCTSMAASGSTRTSSASSSCRMKGEWTNLVCAVITETCEESNYGFFALHLCICLLLQKLCQCGVGNQESSGCWRHQVPGENRKRKFFKLEINFIAEAPSGASGHS